MLRGEQPSDSIFVISGNKAFISFSSHEDANNAFWNGLITLKSSTITLFARHQQHTGRGAASEAQKSSASFYRSTPGRWDDKKSSEKAHKRRHNDDHDDSRTRHRQKRRLNL